MDTNETTPSTSATERGLPISALARGCVREIDNYRCGVPSDDRYGAELFRRATLQGDQVARACIQQCFGGVVFDWLHRHPSREAACRLDSEENYVAQAFERFWLSTTHQEVEFSTLSGALCYLHVSLHGALLDALRVHARTRQVPSPEPGDPKEPSIEDAISSGEVWELLQRLLPTTSEQRLAYLLFHCGLKPREIVYCCPQEFAEVQDIYRLRRTILEQLLHNADRIRW